jgi:hypothetical protein
MWRSYIWNKKNMTAKKTNTKSTSKAVASKASDILKDDRYSDKSKSVAGSALAQKKGKK